MGGSWQALRWVGVLVWVVTHADLVRVWWFDREAAPDPFRLGMAEPTPRQAVVSPRYRLCPASDHVTHPSLSATYPTFSALIRCQDKQEAFSGHKFVAKRRLLKDSSQPEALSSFRLRNNAE